MYFNKERSRIISRITTIFNTCFRTYQKTCINNYGCLSCMLRHNPLILNNDELLSEFEFQVINYMMGPGSLIFLSTTIHVVLNSAILSNQNVKRFDVMFCDFIHKISQHSHSSTFIVNLLRWKARRKRLNYKPMSWLVFFSQGLSRINIKL